MQSYLITDNHLPPNRATTLGKNGSMDVVRIDSHQPLSCVIITDGSLFVSLISAYVFFLFLASLRTFTEKTYPAVLGRVSAFGGGILANRTLLLKYK